MQRFVTEEWRRNQKNAIYTLKLHAIRLLQKYPDGKTAIPTPKSATAKERTNQLAEECSRRVVAIRKITKPFPVAVTTESNQPIMLNQFSISLWLSRKGSFNEQEGKSGLLYTFQSKCWRCFLKVHLTGS